MESNAKEIIRLVAGTFVIRHRQHLRDALRFMMCQLQTLEGLRNNREQATD